MDGSLVAYSSRWLSQRQLQVSALSSGSFCTAHQYECTAGTRCSLRLVAVVGLWWIFLLFGARVPAVLSKKFLYVAQLLLQVCSRSICRPSRPLFLQDPRTHTHTHIIITMEKYLFNRSLVLITTYSMDLRKVPGLFKYILHKYLVGRVQV